MRATTLLLCLVHISAAQDATIAGLQDEAQQIIGLLQASSGLAGDAYKRTAMFCDRFGHRLVGTANLERSIDWIESELKKEPGFSNVHKEAVNIRKWVRGNESTTLVSPLIGGRQYQLHMSGLGGSVGGHVSGQALVVDSFSDLAKAATYNAVAGKIVVFNQAWKGYRDTNIYRSFGPSIAMRLGAKAVLVKSMASFSLNTPHTGATQYADVPANLGLDGVLVGSIFGKPKIPAAAISTEDAELLARMRERGETITLAVHMSAVTETQHQVSYNTVAEIRGSDLAEEIVMISGHIDSWDVGFGAMDDAGPAFTSWQALKALAKLNLKPRRTIRLVIFTSEEVGGGASTYYKYQSKNYNELTKYSLVMELDSGVWDPRGLRFVGSADAVAIMKEITSLLAPIKATQLLLPQSVESNPQRARFDYQSNYGQTCGNCIGADVIIPMQQFVPGASNLHAPNKKTYAPADSADDPATPVFQGDYFFYHHTEADTVSLLDPGQMDRSAAVVAVTAFAVAMLPTKLPRVSSVKDIALQSQEERDAVNALVKADANGMCTTNSSSSDILADILTPSQCAVIMDEFPKACPEPSDGWSPKTAESYKCSDQCARTFVTAYNDCQTTYYAQISQLSKRRRENLKILVGTEASPCRLTFQALIENGLKKAEAACKPTFDACKADEQCRSEVHDAFRNTLYPASRTLFESKMCESASHEFREFYECAAKDFGGWHNSQCIKPDIWPPPSCNRLRATVLRECTEPSAGWTVTTARSYKCPESCARALHERWHFCQQSFYTTVNAMEDEQRAAFFALIDEKPMGPCTTTFRNAVSRGLQAIEKGPCGHYYDVCATSGWCKANLRELIESNLINDPESKSYYEASLCKKAPAVRALYQCVDGRRDKDTSWRMASCAIPDQLSKTQCKKLVANFHKDPSGNVAVCPTPASGWSPASAKTYKCPAQCAQTLFTTYFQCQSTWFTDFDAQADSYKQTLMALVSRDPESPGPCSVTEMSLVRDAISTIAKHPKCKPLFNKCYRDLDCRKHIQDGIRAMSYPASRVKHESQMCTKPLEYQELHECSTTAMQTELEAKPWRRSTCIQPDELPPVFCRYLVSNLSATCPSDPKAPLTPETAMSYTCSEQCAQSLVTAWHYCQTSLYLAVKAWDEQHRGAREVVRVLTRPDPPGPCTSTFRQIIGARLMEVETDPVCGPLYDECAASGWCMYNLREAARSVQNKYLIQQFEATMCDSDKSVEFQRLYECMDTQSDGDKGWKRSKCAEADVLTPSQCAVLLRDFDKDSVHPACEAPKAGWTPKAIESYTCSEQCASELTTAWLECRTSWWQYVETNAGGWSEAGRDTLMAMVDSDPDRPGPCLVTRRTMVKTTMTKLSQPETCGRKHRACLRKFKCRMELEDAIGRQLTQAARIHFEGNLCGKTRELQDLYECASNSLSKDSATPFYKTLPWGQKRCWKPDSIPQEQCKAVMYNVRTVCPSINRLTVENAKTYKCPAQCGKALITAWHYCQTHFRTLVQALDNSDAWFAVVNMDEASPGPCAVAFKQIISSEVQQLASGQCKLQFDNCVGGTNRGRCMRDLREALGALQYPQGHPIELFENNICEKSREFQWLYSCVRQNDRDTETSWSMAQCAKPDVLSYVQCNALVDDFRERKACAAPTSGKWDPASAKSYDCKESCAAALSTAMWVCQATFLKFVSDDSHSRDQKIALYILVADDPLKAAQPRGVCSKVSRKMIEERVERVKTDSKCSALYDVCFADIKCREMIRRGIASSFSPHAKRYFEGGLCQSSSYRFQELYECTQVSNAADTGRLGYEWTEPWTRKSCVVPDELSSEECSALMSGVKGACPGAGLLSVEDAPSYSCSLECSRSLVAIISQCQTSLVTIAEEKWSARERSVFRALVSRDESLGIGPCRQTFGEIVSKRLIQIEASEQCGAKYDKCVARRDGWCKSNLYHGVGAVQTEAGRVYHESQLCSMSPEYQHLYTCVSNSGFSTAENSWSVDDCTAATFDSLMENSVGGLVWLLLGVLIGGVLSYCCAKRRFLRGDTGGQYRPVSENEVRSLIREYVDTEGVKPEDGDANKGLYSDRP